MKRNMLILLSTLSWALAASADGPQVHRLFGETTAPASQPAALPPGHPAIGQPEGLPAGHPALPAGHPAIPPGAENHSAQPGANTPSPELPAGHPDLAQLTRKDDPNAPKGVSVFAMQKTRDGSPIAGDTVTLELYDNDVPVKRFEAKLDDKGAAFFGNLPLEKSFQPVVRILHAGVLFAGVGQNIDAEHPRQNVAVAVYDSTDQEPAWRVKMRHFIVEPSKEGLHVIEMVALENPGDRVWTGRVMDSVHLSVALPIPTGAQHLELGQGFTEGQVTVVEGKVIDHLPLAPGQPRYEMAYTIPASNGRAQIVATSSVPVDNTMLVIPDDGTLVETSDLKPGGTADMGNGKRRTFIGGAVAANQTVTVSVGNLAVAPSRAGEKAATPAAASWAPKIAGGSAVVLLLGGVLVIFLKPRAKASIKVAPRA